VRDANTVHGSCSQAEGEALRALGEEPADFEATLNDGIEEWQRVTGFAAPLAKRLARALWKCERDDRWQESVAIRQLQRLDENTARAIREAEAQFKTDAGHLEVAGGGRQRDDYCNV